METTRRAFLVAVAGGAVQLVLACGSRDPEQGRAVIDLSGGFQDMASVDRVGREFLATLPRKIDADTLLDQVAPERGSLALRDEIRSQYSSGDTVTLRGWPLALTEARIFALVHLWNGRVAAE